LILSLDVGMTTGACLLTEDYKVDWNAPLNLDELSNVLSVLEPTHMVVELPLLISTSKLAFNLQEATSIVKAHCLPDTAFVRPSDWKQTPQAKVKVPRGLTHHERDAIRIAAWYNYSVLKGGKVPSMIEYT
jgi:hypothetical protein